MIPRVMQSDYMHFAKYGAGARYNLATSGVKDCVLADLGVALDDIALHGPNAGGYGPLIERVALRFGVETSAIVMPGGGCSFANHLALAALVAPGDEVLIEAPTYELIASTLGYLQVDLRTFERRLDEGWRLDVDRVAAAITPKTRLVVLTNLHNPSSALADNEAVTGVAEAAAKVGAMVFIDEVYRELTFQGGTARTAYRDGGNIVISSSLTKAYGVSGLRCGWIIAPPPLALRMSRLHDLYGVQPPHVAERLGVVAFDRLDALRARANDIIDANRAAYRELLGGHPKLVQTLFEHGTTVFPRLVEGDGDALFARLTTGFETSLGPGRYFGRPDHVRIGLGGDPEMTRVGLERVAEALG